MEIILYLMPSFLLIAILTWFLIGYKFDRHRAFFHKSYTFVDLSFILIYFLEQLVLAIILAFNKYEPTVIAGIFAIIIMTTVSLQNKAYESRINKINEKSIEQHNIIYSTTKKNRDYIELIKDQKQRLEEANKFINELYQELKHLVNDNIKSDLKKSR